LRVRTYVRATEATRWTARALAQWGAAAVEARAERTRTERSAELARKIVRRMMRRESAAAWVRWSEQVAESSYSIWVPLRSRGLGYNGRERVARVSRVGMGVSTS